jgi:hypothetical protein
VLDVVLVPLLARQHAPELPRRRRRREEPVVPGVGGARAEHDELPVLRPADPDREELVLLLVHVHRLSARLEAPQRVGPLRDRVLGDVEERPAVRGPRRARHPLGERPPHRPRPQVLDEQLVLPEAGVVGRVDELPVVVAHLELADGQESPPLRHLVLVEEHLLRGGLRVGPVRPRRPPAADRVLQALDRAPVVVEAPDPRGDAEVGLLDPAQHLLVQGVGERLQVRGHGLRVGVLRLEVPHHVGRALLAKPVVGVDERAPVPDLHVVLAGRRGGRGGGAGAGQESTSSDQEDGGDESTTHVSGPPRRVVLRRRQ